MENDNLLQRCKTLEADFNALDTYLEKRDFVIQFHNEFDYDLDAKSLLNEFHNYNFSNLPCVLNPKHNAPIVYEFSTKIKGNRKTKFDAFYKAIELLEIEFKKIEPKLILKIAVEIIIEIYKDGFDNDYKELKKFANLLIKSPHHAHDRFFNNSRIDLKYYRGLQMKIYKDYLFEPHLSISDGYIDFFRFSIYDNTFFNYYNIDNEALAAKLKEYINTILNDESPPPTASNNSANEIKVELQKLSGEIGKIKQEIKETPPQQIIIKEVQQNKKAIPIPTTKTPTSGNRKPYKPHKYEPCTVISSINAKITYLIGIGELDKIIEQYKVDNKLPKLVDVLTALKELKFKDKGNKEVNVFDASVFNEKPSDNKVITQYIRNYLHYKKTGLIKGNWPINNNSIHKVQTKLKNSEFKEIATLFNANLPQ